MTTPSRSDSPPPLIKDESRKSLKFLLQFSFLI